MIDSKAGTKSVRFFEEAQLVNALDYVSDTIIRLDFEGGLHYATAAARALFGRRPEELIGTQLLSLVHPDDRVRLAQTWRMLRFGRAQVPCVYRTRHNGGLFIWTEAAFRPLPNGDRGEPREIVGVLRDITWRVNADEILDGGEKLADILIANVVDYAMYLLDLDGNVKSWNAGAQRIKGYQAQEIIGTNFAVFYTDEAVQAGEPMQSLELARSAGKFEAEGWRRRKDGTCFWASVVIAPVRDRSGALVGYAKVTRDVSQRRAERAALEFAAAELRVSSERVKLATQGAGIGIWERDLVAQANWWDTTMFALHGLDDKRSAPTYEEWTALVHLDDRERAAAALAGASAGTGGYDTEFRVVWPNGEVHHIRALGTLVTGKDGTPQRMVGANWDITELRTLAEQLRKEKDAAMFAARRDQLTGLLNRRGLEDWVEAHRGQDATLAYLDIDGFKAINDCGGHAAGDEALRRVARIISQAVRDGDAAARMGGDEFLIVLVGSSDAQHVLRVLERIKTAASKLHPLGPKNDTTIGISVGIGKLAGDVSFAGALRDADADLYRNKTQGPRKT